jgi:ribosomal protein L11 methyltransferase
MIRLALRVRGAEAELVLAELLELAPAGVEEVDLGDGVVEYAVYGPPGELPELPDLRAAAGGALVEVRTEEIADDWGERWKAFHRPLRLGDRLEVRPPWEPGAGAEVEIVIDPGQAFGTGAHATTRLCLQALLELPAGGAFADWGSGSGVLAIVAAKLGWHPVVACDNDPLSIEATAENARVNGVELAVMRVNLREGPGPSAPTVVANLMRPLLLRVAELLQEPPERMILSGLLVHEADEVAAAFAVRGLREARRSELGDWAALVLER